MNKDLVFKGYYDYRDSLEGEGWQETDAEAGINIEPSNFWSKAKLIVVPEDYQEDEQTKEALFDLPASVNHAEATLNLGEESFRVFVEDDEGYQSYFFLAKDYNRLVEIFPEIQFMDRNGEMVGAE